MFEYHTVFFDKQRGYSDWRRPTPPNASWANLFLTWTGLISNLDNCARNSDCLWPSFSLTNCLSLNLPSTAFV